MVWASGALHEWLIENMSEPYLIFDFDGVIADTKQSAAEVIAKNDGVSVEEAMRESVVGYASRKPSHTRGHSLSPAELHEIYEWTVSYGTALHEHGFPLFQDFVSEIESIPTTYKAIVSSGSQQYVIPALEQTKINPTHILAYENHHSKEEKIELICTDWGVTSADVFYFTDTLADVYELQNMIAPDKLIGVAWGFCGFDLLAKELSHEYILKKPSDIHHII